MKTKIKIAFSAVIIGIAVACYLEYDFRNEELPILEAEKAKVVAEVDAKRAELRKLENFAQNIEVVKREIKELNLQLESALEYMPRSYNLSGLLRKLTLIAQNSGVELTTFKPKKMEDKKDGTFFASLLVDMDFKGSFPQVLVFLDQMSRLKRVVHLEGLKLKQPAVKVATASRNANVWVTASASLRTYRFAE